MVRQAMTSGKRAICAGPGNPPVVVDATADLNYAARNIIAGASFDNNIVCVDEKEVIAVESVVDDLLQHMGRHGARVLPVVVMPEQGGERDGQAADVLLCNTAFAGRNASGIIGEEIAMALLDVSILMVARCCHEGDVSF